jgi:hypothetical protein
MSETHDPRTALQALREFLRGIDPGPISEDAKVVRLLEAAWNELRGSGEENTSADKLTRAEDLSWQPPELTFTLERHGGTVMGSTRAELHEWVVDVEDGIATCSRTHHRQLEPRARPFTAARLNKLVEEIAQLILAGADDPRLEWSRDRSRVRVLISEISMLVTVQQTQIARRRRFRDTLETRLKASGWVRAAGARIYTYEHISTRRRRAPGEPGRPAKLA